MSLPLCGGFLVEIRLAGGLEQAGGGGDLAGGYFFLEKRLDFGGCGGIAAEETCALGEAAEIAGGVAEPAVGWPGFGWQALGGQGVEFGEPEGGGGGGGPGEEELRGVGWGEGDGVGAKGDEGGLEAGGGEEVGEDAAGEHFVFDLLGRQGDADGDGLALADLILEDAQGFVEGIDEEVDDAGAECLLLGGGVGSGGEGGGSGDVGGDEDGAGFRVEMTRVEKLAAEGWFLREGGEGDEGRVEAFDLEGEVEGGRCVRLSEGVCHQGR